jgi:predicted O-methyltransferase YrrM
VDVGPFDLVVVDGNHEGAYLSRELGRLARLLRTGGLLVVDDVEVGPWDDVVDAFEAATSTGTLREIGRDGRMGVLQAVTASLAS